MKVITQTDKISFIRKIFGDVTVARDGINIAVSCPACGTSEKKNKKKLSINIETWVYHCWVCNARGRNLSYLLKKSFPESSFFLDFREIFGFSSAATDHKKEPVEEKVSLPAGFKLLSSTMKTRDPDISACVKYLRSRGLSLSDIRRFRIGSVSSGKFRRRVIIPSFDQSGDLNYFCSRSIDPKSTLAYINSRASKREVIFNEIDLDWSKPITIVEGPFDMFKSCENTTCLLGSSLTEDYLLFKRIVANKSDVYLALDADAKKKSNKIGRLFSSYGCKVMIVNVPPGLDVGSLEKDEFLKIKELSKPWSIDDFLKDKIRSIQSGSII